MQTADRPATLEPLRMDNPSLVPAVLDTLGALVVVLDRQGRIVYFNRACEDLTGYSFAEVAGRTVWDFLLPPEDREPVMKVFGQLKAGLFPAQHENDWLTRDGERHRIAWSNTAVLDPAGEIQYVVGTGLDMSDRLRVEQSVRRRDAILDAVGFAAAQFLSAVNWETQIDIVLERLGLAAGVDRVYIFQNSLSENGDLTTGQRYAWRVPGEKAFSEAPAHIAMSYMQLPHWKDILGCGEPVFGLVSQFPEPERSLLQRMNIVSILLAPIFANRHWWGFIGFEQCDPINEWSGVEVDALKAAASILGAAIQHAREEQVNASILKISEAAHLSQNLDTLYSSIHAIVNELMPAKNFYIALHDPVAEVLNFPYIADEYPSENPSRKLRKGLTEYVLTTGKPGLVTPEVFDDLLARGEVELCGVRAVDWLGVPLSARGKTIGVLAVQSYTPDVRFSADDVDILVFVSNEIAMAIERKRAEDALQRQLEELRVLHGVTLASSVTMDEDALIERATHLIGAELFPDNFGLLLADLATGDLRFHVSYQGINDEHRGTVIPRGKGITGKVAATGQVIRLGDTKADADYLRLFFPARSELCVPLKVGERVIGVINAESEDREAFSEDDERLLVILASQLALAIEQKRAEQALKESEEHYRSLVESLPIGICRVTPGPQGEFLMANRALLTMLGFESEAALARFPVSRLYQHPDEYAQLSERILKEGQVAGIEVSLTRRDGTLLWGSITATLARDLENLPAYFDCTIEDVTERKKRARERDAMISFLSVLRVSQTRVETLAIVVNNLLWLFEAESVALVMRRLIGEQPKVEAARGQWAAMSGKPLARSDMLCQSILSTGCRYASVSGADAPPQATVFDTHPALACIPLVIQGQTTGLFCLGRTNAFSEDDIHLLEMIGDMAANAIHQVTFYEQTQQQVQRLAALRTVDMTISSSMDLRLALTVILDHLANQLALDAVAVLLLRQREGYLEYVAGRGFRSPVVTRSRIRLGEGIAGRAALERRAVEIVNLAETSAEFLHDRGLTNDGFVSYCNVPLIAKGELKGVLEVFQRSPLDFDPDWLDFLQTMAGQAAIAIDNNTLFEDLQRSNLELAMAYDTTLEGWIRTLDLRDQETEGHTKRVTEMTLRLASVFNISESEQVHIRRGALLHDIGKMAIPDAVLLKHGPLTAEEWDVMRRHPRYAYDLLYPITYLRHALEIPYCHHEKWDGTGYPRNLKGEQIPLSARIFAIVDVWDAMLSDRPYRKGLPIGEAIRYIREQSGKHFDPAIVAVFLKLPEIYAKA